MFAYDYSLEHVCSLRYRRAGSDVIGATPAGVKMFGYLAGGEVSGPRLRGSVRPLGGGDWGTVRADDIIDIDARIVIETHDSALIYVTYFGVVALPEGGSTQLREGRIGGKAPLRTTPRMYASDPRYAWVNRELFLGIGMIDFDQKVEAVTYDFYVVH